MVNGKFCLSFSIYHFPFTIIKMNNENKNNSNLPLIIIGAVLLAAIAGGWYFYQTSKSATAVKSTASNANKKDDSSALKAYQNAPPGAQPPDMLGSPNAAVTVEEFADYQCPACASTFPKIKEINSIYGSRIKFVFRNFPLEMHPNAYDAAVAAESAGMQNKLWEMQNLLFTNQQKWGEAADARKIFKEYAQKIGLDAEKFENDTLGLAAKSRVDLDMARGRSLGINSTPTIFINGRQVAYEQMDVGLLQKTIDAELQKAQGGGQTNNQTNTANAVNK